MECYFLRYDEKREKRSPLPERSTAIDIGRGERMMGEKCGNFSKLRAF